MISKCLPQHHEQSIFNRTQYKDKARGAWPKDKCVAALGSNDSSELSSKEMMLVLFGLARPTGLAKVQGDKATEHRSLLHWSVSLVETYRPDSMQLRWRRCARC